jgi:hypothetical protein
MEAEYEKNIFLDLKQCPGATDNPAFGGQIKITAFQKSRARYPFAPLPLTYGMQVRSNLQSTLIRKDEKILLAYF